MKKVLSVVLTVVMVMAIAAPAFASVSPSYYYDYSWATSESSTASKPTSTKTTVTQGTGIVGNWAKNTDGWTFTNNGAQVKSQWAYVVNPYVTSGDQSGWYYFDENGKMLTGWQWIKGSDGVFKCYYLHEASDGKMGLCLLNGTAPDGRTVNANGELVVNGVVQTK